MERLTYDFCFNGSHSNQVKGADNLTCSEVCEREESCNECPIARAFDRLAAIEDILGDDYNLDHLRELMEADNLIGKKIYITKWPFKGRFIKDDPTERTIHHILVTKIEILLQFKDGSIPIRCIGKTAFLGREEAKAALEKMKEAARE